MATRPAAPPPLPPFLAAWDSTGAEEIWVWARHFGLQATADVAVEAVTAYMPGGVPHWGYNGGALSLGDASNNARLTPFGGWERILGHYRAGAAGCWA